MERRFQLRCILALVLLCPSLLMFCAIDVRAEGAEQTSEHNDIQIKVVTKDKRAADFLEAIIEPLAEETADKIKKLDEEGEELPMNVKDPTVDCTEYEGSLREYDEKMMASLIDVREILYANNELTLWGKIKAINALRVVLQYGLLERPFTPGYCLDIFEEEFFPRYERTLDEVIELSDR